jgi:uncharacterized membrane protein HdeD (DUF308 family)
LVNVKEKQEEIFRLNVAQLSIRKEKEVSVMVEQLTRNWWAVGLRGLFAILLGIMALVWPGITLEALIIVFGAYAIVDGIFAIAAAGTSASLGGRWGWMLFEGILSILAGIVAFVWPSITALALLWVISVYAFATGILEIAAAFQLGGGNGWLLGLGGALSIVFSILLVVWPASGLLSLVWLIGLYALFFGFMLIGLAYQLYRLHRATTQTGKGLMA